MQSVRLRIFSALAEKLDRLTIPKNNSDERDLTFWKERVVSTILLTTVVLGFFAYVPSVMLCIEERLFGIAIFDTVVYAFVIFLFVSPRLSFDVRAYAIITISYLVGLVLLAIVGPAASGPVWLFIFPVLAAVLLGFRPAMAALAMNIVTLVVCGILIYEKLPRWLYPEPHNPERWVTISFNFILLNAMAAFSISMILKGLQKSLEYEKNIRRSLENQVAERIEAEKALKESEIRYRTLFNGAAEGIIITDLLTFQIVLLNQSAACMLKYDETKLTGYSLMSVISPEWADNSAVDELRDHYADRSHLPEFPLIASDGSIIYADISNARINIDHRDCIVSFLTDVSERKKKRG